MQNATDPKELFNRERRRRFRDRSFRRTQGKDFIGQIMSEEILDRLSLIKRDFKKCLLIGQASHVLAAVLNDMQIETIAADAGFDAAAAARGIQCDEDRLPFVDQSFDLVINVGALDSVNDLPGALTLTRRILKPDGLLLAAFVGAESLTTLKSLMMQAEGDSVAPHIHPQIDIRTIGDLVSRVGLTLPVIDSDGLNLRYADWSKLIGDIRDMGGSNALDGDTHPISRSVYSEAKRLFKEQADTEGKTTEHIELIYLCAWAPHPGQPKPARRGSGQTSLKTALTNKTDLQS
ncbi:methyltransferase domain-containing protein [Parasphingorhabdus litoris]|uniref:Methyltransferase domain-containing protein n=1 Tax=Parasphingorhabdus litoris TaxID=394733 RepID=A0ABN1AEE8_9SPHN|nr:methyltransferase domain-containing protein [Parasphingorhabdus litoris]